MYFDYLRSGDAEPLRSVFYHNAMDVISLAALLNHAAGLLSDPFHSDIQHGVDLISMARLYEDMGEIDLATRLYLHGLQHLDVREQRLPEEIYLLAIERLANIHKRSENLQAAIDLWQEAALHRHVVSHVELAKVYEHRLKDFDQAIHWTRSAIDLVNQPDFNPYQKKVWLDELEHRIDRLLRKKESHG
jgi:hypothetical protein